MLRNTLLPVAVACITAIFCPSSAQNFRVQVAVYETPITKTYFEDKGILHVIEETDQNGLHRYYVGAYNTREEADDVLQQLQKKGFTRATVLDMEEQRALCGTPCPYKNYVQDPSQSLTVRNIFFDTDKSTLSVESKKVLDEVYKLLKENPGDTLKIIGRTDDVGSVEYNINLATHRGRAARNYLIEKGIPAKRIFIKVLGEFNTEKPKDENERRSRRRVTLTLVKPGGEVSNNRDFNDHVDLSNQPDRRR